MALLVLASHALFYVPVCRAEAALPGVPNFHQVSGSIYRGGQPTSGSWVALAKIGVKVVIDLRHEHPDEAEQRAVQAAGMRYVSVPMSGMAAPPDSKIRSVLALLNDSDSAGAVFVHCRRGADRTGTAIACYRIAHDGWTNTKALDEAKSYGMSPLEVAMRHYVLAFRATTLQLTSTPPATLN